MNEDKFAVIFIPRFNVDKNAIGSFKTKKEAFEAYDKIQTYGSVLLIDIFKSEIIERKIYT